MPKNTFTILKALNGTELTHQDFNYHQMMIYIEERLNVLVSLKLPQYFDSDKCMEIHEQF